MIEPPLTPELLAMSASTSPRFEWDEWQFQSYFYYAFDDELELFRTLTQNANHAFTIAICEWIEHRFSGLSFDPIPLEYICSGWAALLKSSYSDYLVYDDREWCGPVRAPLMAAFGIVNEIFYESGDEHDPAFGTCYALNLARHVMPEGTEFDSWSEKARTRLQAHHLREKDPGMVVDIFSDKFPSGRHVSRDAFDLGKPYEPEGAESRLRDFAIRQADLGNQFINLHDIP